MEPRPGGGDDFVDRAASHLRIVHSTTTTAITGFRMKCSIDWIKPSGRRA
jgi:hypothetical protein